MSNGNLQRKQVEGLTDTYLEYNAISTQALLLGAYIEDKKKWEDARYNLSLQITDVLNNAKTLAEKFRHYSRLKLKIFKLFGIKTTEEKSLLKLKATLEILNKEMTYLMENPPNPGIYELAAMGNLFKAR